VKRLEVVTDQFAHANPNLGSCWEGGRDFSQEQQTAGE